MAVLRTAHKSKFTVIDNDVFKSSLSLKARGLLSTMLSLPDNWNFSIRGLTSILPSDGETAVRSALTELEARGYLTRAQIRDEAGRITDWLWTFSDYPQTAEKPHVENPHVDDPHVEGSHVDTRPQLNTNQLRTKGERNHQSNTDGYEPPATKAETSTETTTIPDTASTAAAKKPKATVAEKKERFGEYGNVMLTADDVEELQDRFPADWRERVENLSAYMESTGKTYRNHRATIENWARMDEERARRDSPSRGRAASPSKAAPVRDEPSVEDVMRDCLCDRETALEIIKEGLA